MCPFQMQPGKGSVQKLKEIIFSALVVIDNSVTVGHLSAEKSSICMMANACWMQVNALG